jgi:hypothetical protein
MPDHDGAHVPLRDGLSGSGVEGTCVLPGHFRCARQGTFAARGRALSLRREGQPFPEDALALYAVPRAILVRKASTG